MRKPVLGRTLGALLENHGAAPSSGAPDAEPTVELGMGVRSLVRGSHTHGEEPKAPEINPDAISNISAVKRGRPFIPVWYFFGADLLLVATAWMVVFKSVHPISWPKAVFCISAVALGAVLSLYAISCSPSDTES